jgi:hypothetical protein
MVPFVSLMEGSTSSLPSMPAVTKSKVTEVRTSFVICSATKNSQFFSNNSSLAAQLA